MGVSAPPQYKSVHFIHIQKVFKFSEILSLTYQFKIEAGIQHQVLQFDVSVTNVF